MPTFTFHMGIDVRAYGNVKVTADTAAKAVAMLTPDYVSEHIDPGEVTWDNASNLSIIDTTDEAGANVPDWTGIDLPEPDTTPSTAEGKAQLAEVYLRRARDLLKGAGATRAVDRVRLAITSVGGAVRNARGKAVRVEMEG